MFILENVLITFLVMVSLLLLFTFFNVLSFTKDVITGIYLTFIFFDLYFRMPYKAINNIYNDREKLVKKINKQKDIPDKQKEQFKHLLKNRYRLFLLFFKSGGFSYTDLMSNFERWFTKKPFKVRVKVIRMNRQRFENKYLNDFRKDILGTS